MLSIHVPTAATHTQCHNSTLACHPVFFRSPRHGPRKHTKYASSIDTSAEVHAPQESHTRTHRRTTLAGLGSLVLVGACPAISAEEDVTNATLPQPPLPAPVVVVEDQFVWQPSNSPACPPPDSLPASCHAQTGFPPLCAIFSPGFLVSPSAYESYLRTLAVAGLPAAVYEVPQSATDPIDDIACSEILGSVMAWCRNQSQLQSLLLKEASGVSETTQEVASPPVEKPQPQPQLSSSEGQPTTSSELQFILMGHSRGGKISTLQAASRPESVAGLVLVDPVDASFEAGSGSKVDPRFPSAAEQLPAMMPTLIIGAGQNKDCIPVRANYDSFFRQASGNCTLIKLNDAGHFAFLDSQTFLQQSACNAGKADGEALRTACASCIVYFANVVASRDAGCDAVPLRYQWLLSSYGLKYELFGK